VTFVVLRNGGYDGLRLFFAPLGVASAPGLDLPGLDAVQIARGYGVPAEAVTTGEELAAALSAVATAGGPRLLELAIRPRPLP
jgi:benzoylformate decarboxylase